MSEQESNFEITNENIDRQTVVKPLETKPKISFFPIIITATAIILGILSGKYLFNQNFNSALLKNNSSLTNNQPVSAKGIVVGSTDTKTFKDCAMGELIKNDGKITTEGSHKLLREGGESQSVYLTSSVVDLDQFIQKNVQVCGETNKAQKAGWLMDVGRVITQ
jgi:hypothetical protein